MFYKLLTQILVLELSQKFKSSDKDGDDLEEIVAPSPIVIKLGLGAQEILTSSFKVVPNSHNSLHLSEVRGSAPYHWVMENYAAQCLECNRISFLLLLRDSNSEIKYASLSLLWKCEILINHSTFILFKSFLFTIFSQNEMSSESNPYNELIEAI